LNIFFIQGIEYISYPKEKNNVILNYNNEIARLQEKLEEGLKY
jgi:low affinity Fe/Cu permease